MAAMTPEKLKELMLKVRKGATSSFTAAQISAVLEALGGSLEPIVGFSSYDHDGHPSHVYGDTEEEAKVKYNEVKKYLVSSLPAKAKAGVLYVKNLQEPKHGLFHVQFNAFVGTIGMRVELGGKKAELFKAWGNLTDIRDILKGAKKQSVYMFDVVRWLTKEADWVTRVNDFLDIEAHIPGAVRTRDQTGSCPVCFQNIKLSPSGNPPRIVLHGYQRPGHGVVTGKCFGVGYPPFELSVDGTRMYLTGVLIPKVDNLRRRIDGFKSGDVQEFSIGSGRGAPKKITSTDPDWDRLSERHVDELERDLAYATQDKDAYTRLKDHWVERPLPKEGEMHIDWFSRGQKSASSAQKVALAVVVAGRFLQANGWKTVNPRSFSEPERDQIWEMFVNTYKKIGLTQSSIEGMIADYDVWEVFYDGGDLRAFGVAKKTTFGTKAGLVGSDGSPEGKSAIKSYLATIFKRPGHYSEVSHAVEHLVLSAGSPVVCSTNVEPVLKKPIDPLDDGLHYKRSLSGVGVVTKVMVGNPRGIPTTTATNPHCELPSEDRTSSNVDMVNYSYNRYSDEDSCDLDAHYACQIDLE